MAREQFYADAPVGKQIITALRQEAAIFESDGQEARARNYRRLADKMEYMAHALSPKKTPPEGGANRADYAG